ncbi:MAG: hypothetical protein EAZ37_01290 [Burkholderiales bacterium]|nr:MAG: hypothetical protein EAZ43_13120 [Betaproteobacteria bacterium]TAG28552.1 MAG: hypothetical protein EAZ37_01290 [Burkholderiales bacterium]
MAMIFSASSVFQALATWLGQLQFISPWQGNVPTYCARAEASSSSSFVCERFGVTVGVLPKSVGRYAHFANRHDK